MNSDDFIKERSSYKVGYCVKLARQFSDEFPPNEICIITKLTENDSGERCYLLKKEDESKVYHYSYVFRDSDCKSMERKLKLEKIKKNDKL